MTVLVVLVVVFVVLFVFVLVIGIAYWLVFRKTYTYFRGRNTRGRHNNTDTI